MAQYTGLCRALTTPHRYQMRLTPIIVEPLVVAGAEHLSETAASSENQFVGRERICPAAAETIILPTHAMVSSFFNHYAVKESCGTQYLRGRALNLPVSSTQEGYAAVVEVQAELECRTNDREARRADGTVDGRTKTFLTCDATCRPAAQQPQQQVVNPAQRLILPANLCCCAVAT